MGGTLTNGTDTTEAFPVTQDVYGFSLHYYKNDYRAIGYSAQATSVLGALTTNAAPLYNGNIAAMAVNIPQLSATKLYNYHYDQLNRIVAMDMYNGLSPTAGTFTPVSDTSYKERVSYDPNGNILGYLRNGDAGNTMDNLNYIYYSSSNKLSQVIDNVSATKYSTDIDNQAANNYTYDAIGNMISDAGDSIYSTSPITWNVYGKILSVTRNSRVIRYVYDAGGNRIMKYTNADTTVYVRDATGNVMSVYSKPANNSSIVQTEMHLYGSSRLGMATQHLAADTGFNLSNGFGSITGRIFTRGEKFFELSNHLGNVLATISDRRIQVDANSDGTVDSYKADIVSANDYYPFGMLMPGRKYSIANTNYRYGFNGKENDNDIENSAQDYGMRIYDGRLGRFLSVDPIAKKFPALSLYQFSGDNPISTIDLDGLEPAAVNKGTQALVIILQGYGGDPPDNNTQASNAAKTKSVLGPDNALGSIGSTGTKLKVVVYASSQTDNTKIDVLATIKNFRSINPNGKVILVGHSGGADNIVELAKENKDVKIDLMITLDVRDPKKLGWTDTNIPSNVKNEINYYQNTDKLNLISDRKMDFSNETNGVNILSPGSNHRSIDNDQVKNVILDINNEIFNRNPVENAKDRVQPMSDPKKTGSEPIPHVSIVSH